MFCVFIHENLSNLSPNIAGADKSEVHSEGVYPTDLFPNENQIFHEIPAFAGMTVPFTLLYRVTVLLLLLHQSSQHRG